MATRTINITGNNAGAMAAIRGIRAGFASLARAANAFASNFSTTVNSSIRRSFARLKSFVSGIRASFTALTGVIGRVFNKMTAFVGIVGLGLLAKQVHQITSAFISANNALSAVVGTAEDAGNAMDYLIGQSQRLGVDVQTLTRAYLKFMAAGRESRSSSDELHDMFEALAETGTILQFNTQELEGAFRALTQMMSKGKVQAEELRGQLGEHLPGAFEIAAKSMGLTTRQLDEMLKKGEVTADMLISKLPQGLRDAYGSALPGAIVTARAEFNRLSNDVKIFLEDNKETIDAIFKKIAESVRELFNNIQRSGLLDWLLESNTGFSTMLDFIAQLPKNIEIVAVKAQAFYEISILKLQEFWLRAKEVLGQLSEEESRLLNPQRSRAEGFGGGSYKDFLEGIAGEDNNLLGRMYENHFQEQARLIEEGIDANIALIERKYKRDLPRVTETSGAGRVPFRTNSDAPEESEPLKQMEVNQIAAFQRMVAQLQGATAEQEVIYNQFMEKITKLRADNLITEEQYFEAQELAYSDHVLKLLEIQEDFITAQRENNAERIAEEARGWSYSAKLAEQSLAIQKKTSFETTRDVLGLFQGLTAGLASESKSAFEFHKAMSMGIAAIKGYEATIAAYAYGANIGGPPLGAAFAAVAAAATGKLLSQMSQANFGGGAQAASSSGGNVSTSTDITGVSGLDETQTRNQEVSRNIVVEVSGNVYANDDFRRSIVEAIREAEDNDES